MAAVTNTRKNYDKDTTIVIDVVRAFLPAVFNEKGVNHCNIGKSLELEKNEDRLEKLLLPGSSKLDIKYPNYDNIKFKFAGYGRSRVEIKTDKNGTVHYYPTSGGILKVANATVIDKETCRKSWKFDISDKHICISIIEDEQKKNHQGTCRDDSGSPAVIDDKVIIGIDNVGNIRCDNNFKPSIFTKVSTYLPFIKGMLNGKTDGAVVYTS